MEISLIDASEYFRGLLLLVAKDRTITETEKHLMKRIGKTMGLEREFCENAIHDVMENTFIADTPPKFSTHELAVKFIKDALTLATSDNELHTSEMDWLRLTAEKNGLDFEAVVTQWQTTTRRKDREVHLELDDLILGYR